MYRKSQNLKFVCFCFFLFWLFPTSWDGCLANWNIQTIWFLWFPLWNIIIAALSCRQQMLWVRNHMVCHLFYGNVSQPIVPICCLNKSQFSQKTVQQVLSTFHQLCYLGYADYIRMFHTWSTRDEDSCSLLSQTVHCIRNKHKKE